MRTVSADRGDEHDDTDDGGLGRYTNFNYKRDANLSDSWGIGRQHHCALPFADFQVRPGLAPIASKIFICKDGSIPKSCRMVLSP
jgi:hypothetical protein